VQGVYLTPEGEVGYTELEHVRVYAATGRRHPDMPPAPRDPEELAALEEKWKERRALEQRRQVLAEGDRRRRGPRARRETS
jgi:hypothetical protein